MRLASHVVTEDGWRLDGLVLFRVRLGFPTEELSGAAWVRYRGDTVRLGTWPRVDPEWEREVYDFLVGGRGGIPVRWTPPVTTP